MSSRGGSKKELLHTIQSLQTEVSRLSELQSRTVDLLHDLWSIYEEDTGIKTDACDQDTTQYQVYAFLVQQPSVACKNAADAAIAKMGGG